MSKPPTVHATRPLLSVVVPAYNESEVLPEFHARVTRVLDALALECEIVYVNDGSSDATLRVLEQLLQQDRRVVVIDLSRNYGKEIALTAGLDHCRGDAAVVIDADLQDPPELIPALLRKWQEGFDVVYATRTRRHGESWLKQKTAQYFYALMQKVSETSIPPNTGDFRLLNRAAIDALVQYRETHRFMKGLFSLIGFAQVSVPYERDPRFAGETKWNYWKLWNLALEGITSFTVAPLKISTYLGLIVAFGAFFYGLHIIVKTLIFGADLAGYPSMMVVILFMGGVQLISIGLIGEYLGRIFNETKMRPLYFVRKVERTDGPHESA